MLEISEMNLAGRKPRCGHKKMVEEQLKKTDDGSKPNRRTRSG